MVSIIINFRNEERHLKVCIDSILAQTYKDFELILIDDASNDRSGEIAKSFKDRRIRFFINEFRQGIPSSRNVGVNKAEGEFIFFTDGDCTLDENWVQEGLRYLTKGYFVVEGKVISLSKDKAISDKKCQNLHGGSWATNNVAYRADILRKLGGFDKKYIGFADRELGLRVIRHGESFFNDKMIAYHSVKKHSVKGYLINKINTGRAQVLLFKNYGDKGQGSMTKSIVFPRVLLRTICPFVTVINIFRVIINEGLKKDYFLFQAFEFQICVIQRFVIWYTALKERIFVI